MKRLTTAIAFVGITIGTWLTLENVARADRSLAVAMSDSETIAIAISEMMIRKRTINKKTQ